MKTTLIAATIATLLGVVAGGAAAASLDTIKSPLARAETERPQKPEKKEKVGALDMNVVLARAETERPQKPEKKEKVG